MKALFKSTKRVTTFIVLTFLLSILPYIRIISDKTLEGNGLFVFLLMWAPGLAAITTKQLFDKNQKGLGWRIGKLKYIGASYLIPLLACLIVYPAVWLIGVGEVNLLGIGETNSESIIRILIYSTLGISGALITATGEEIGWRGFMVPELFKKYSFTKTSIIIGIVWSLYHYPLLLFSDYNNDTSIVLSMIFFTISVFSICFITTWLRMKSGSLWTGAVIHASHNLFVQEIFDPITVDLGSTRLITTEFGIGLSIVYALVAFYFWKRRAELYLNNISTPSR